MAGQRSSDVQSVERAIAILKSFSLDRPERGVSELGRELGLHKSTLYRKIERLGIQLPRRDGRSRGE